MKGKGCAALGAAIQPEGVAQGRSGGEEGRSFSHHWFEHTHLGAPRPGLACPPASSPLPRTFRCTRAQSKSYQDSWGWEDGRLSIPFLHILSSGHGHREWGVGAGERKGDFRSILFLQMGAFKVCIFSGFSHLPQEPLGGFSRAQREEESL